MLLCLQVLLLLIAALATQVPPTPSNASDVGTGTADEVEQADEAYVAAIVPNYISTDPTPMMANPSTSGVHITSVYDDGLLQPLATEEVHK